MKIKEQFKKISKDQLLELEEKIGVIFPNDYKDFLLKNNGGRPSLNVFRTLDQSYESDIQFLFGVTEGVYDIYEVFKKLKSVIPESKIAIAIDSGGNYVLLDLVTHRIFFFDHDIEEIFLISETFTDFIDNLFEINSEESEFDKAVSSQNVMYFKNILESGVHIDKIVDEFDRSLFVVACLRGKLKLVQFLVENGVNIEGGVFSSSSNGHYKVVDYLLKQGGDPNEKDSSQNNDTALIQASMGGFIRVVKLLISKGADINAVDDYGQTALNKSYWSDNQELIDYLENEVY